MLKNEFYRIFIKQKFLLLIPLLLILKMLSLSVETPLIHTGIEKYHDAYVEYISEFSGKLTPDKQNKITSDYAEMLADRETYTALRSGYENGTISEEDYRSAVAEIEDILNEAAVISLAYEEYLYAAADSANRYILYTNGWEAFLAHERLDLILIFGVALLAAVLFGLDYESGAVQIVQTSAFGKSRLFSARQIVLVSAVIGVSVLFFAAEYLYFSVAYSLPMPLAPLQSLVSFRESPFMISIFGAMLYIWSVRILGCLLLSELTAFFVIILKKIWVSVLFCGALTGIPFALWNQNAVSYYFQPLGLLLGNGYFKGAADFVDTEEGLVISSSFAGVAPVRFLGMIMLSVCAGGLLCQTSLQLCTGIPFRNIRHKCVPILFSCVMLMSVLMLPMCAALKQQSAEYTSHYSHGMGFSDANYIYMTDTGLQAVEHDGTNGFSLIRDVTKKADEMTACYVDAEYIYYAQRDLDYGTISYWRIDKQDFHETCVYKETRGQRSQQKRTRYLGLIAEVNVENVAYDTYARESILAFWADHDFLFVLDSDGVDRIDLQKKCSEQILECQIAAGCAAYQNGVLYYADLQNRVYAYDIARNQTAPLDIPHCKRLYLCGGILFFTTFGHEIGYYDGSAHLLENLSINDTSQLSSDGKSVFFCNESLKPVRIDLADFSSEVLDYDAPAYQIKAYAHSPYVSVYTSDSETDAFFWDVCLLEGKDRG